MPLDGLRAWIGEVERKLGMRTRVFLALGAIAIGIGGAAMYLAIDTRSNAVSESDVREMQEQLEAQIGGGLGGAGTDGSQLEAELRALQAEVEQLRGNGGGGGQGSGPGNGGDGGGAGNGGGGAGGGGAGTGGANPGAGGAGAGGADELQDLLEQAQERNEGLE